MKTQKDLEECIVGLKKQLKNKALPKIALNKIREAIILLEWVIE